MRPFHNQFDNGQHYYLYPWAKVSFLLVLVHPFSLFGSTFILTHRASYFFFSHFFLIIIRVEFLPLVLLLNNNYNCPVKIKCFLLKLTTGLCKPLYNLVQTTKEELVQFTDQHFFFCCCHLHVHIIKKYIYFFSCSLSHFL